MGRRTIAAAVLALAGAMLAAPAAAQFGSIFGEPPPRPPQGVPGGRQPSPTPSRIEPGPPTAGQLSSPRPPSGGVEAQSPNSPYGGIQSRPLPPPPGGAAVEQSAHGPCRAVRRYRSAPVQRPRTPAQPADTSPQPGDEVSPNRRRRRSSTRPHCFPASTRSPAASSASMPISERLCSSVRCN